jgi:uncharacterized protein (TIGR01777 family)
MKIAVTGASGFVGRRLNGIAVSTRGEVVLPACDAVVNLAGEPVSQRWTAAVKEKIRSSRIDGTRKLVEAMRKNPPKVLVSASAVGYYGSRGDEVLTESSSPGQDFLGKLAVDWEREALRAEEFGVRVVLLRIGIVLGRDGGALGKMLPIFKMGLGGPIGDGRQWMPWIAIEDLVRMIHFAIENDVRGAMNGSAPNPVTNREFTKALAKAVHRPALFPVPKIALKILYGEMAQILWSSQRAVPEAAVANGFKFDYESVDDALSRER